MRPIWLSIGCLSVALAFIGVALPLLPTVPFLLLAAYCFARSSQRFHDWLLGHRLFGPMILDWRRSGAIRRRAKWAATLSIALAFSISVALGFATWAIAAQAAALTGVMIFIWTRPEGAPVEAVE